MFSLKEGNSVHKCPMRGKIWKWKENWYQYQKKQYQHISVLKIKATQLVLQHFQELHKELHMLKKKRPLWYFMLTTRGITKSQVFESLNHLVWGSGQMHSFCLIATAPIQSGRGCAVLKQACTRGLHSHGTTTGPAGPDVTECCAGQDLMDGCGWENTRVCGM